MTAFGWRTGGSETTVILNITPNEIQQFSTNGKVHAGGRRYYAEGRVRNLRYDPAGPCFSAEVSGSSGRIYQTQIRVNQQNRPIQVRCNCEAFSRYAGCCKHLVAVLTAASAPADASAGGPAGPVGGTVRRTDAGRGTERTADTFAELSPDQKHRLKLARSMLLQTRLAMNRTDRPGAGQQPDPDAAEPAARRSRLHLEFTLKLPAHGAQMARLTLRIGRGGGDKLYKVKQLESLVRALEDGHWVYFGKGLTFFPETDPFDPAGRRAMDWLQNLLLNDRELHPYTAQTTAPAFSGNTLILNPARLRAFFTLMTDGADGALADAGWDVRLHLPGADEPRVLSPAAADTPDPDGTADPAESADPDIIRLRRGWPPVHFAIEPLLPRPDTAPLYRFLLKSGAAPADERPGAADLSVGRVKTDCDLRLLSETADMVLYGRCIYLIDPADRLSRTWLKTLSEIGIYNDLLMTESDVAALLKLTGLPSGENSRLTLPGALSRRIIRTPPVASLRLDLAGRDLIAAAVEFRYGDRTVNPHPDDNEPVFAPGQPLPLPGEPAPGAEAEELVRPEPDSTWLLRDHAAEQRLLDALSAAGLTPRPPRRTTGTPRRTTGTLPQTGAAQQQPADADGLYYLSGAAAIYDFLTVHLPRITDLAAVYYTDAFRQIRVRRLPPAGGRLRLSSDRSLLYMDIEADGLTPDELRQVLAAYREKRRFVRLKNGAFLTLPDAHEDSQGWDILEKTARWDGEWAGSTLAVKPFRALPLCRLFEAAVTDPASANPADTDPASADPAAAGPAGADGRTPAAPAAGAFEADASLAELIRAVQTPERWEQSLPPGVTAKLRTYQHTGYNWFCALHHYGFGGILADEMGLGKTLQALAFIRRFSREIRRPSLVVAPTSLIYNWQDEAARFTPGLRVCVVNGAKSVRAGLWDQAGQCDLLIVSYAVARQDIEQIRAIAFGVCLLDEAQAIKNPVTQTARAVKKIRSLRRFALTGTPVENALYELWSVFDFIMPGYLPPRRTFQAEFELPILRDNDERARRSLRRLTLPFILRRLKKDVLQELPDKIETQLFCGMTPEQDKLYRAYLQKARRSVDALNRGGRGDRHHIQILSLLTRLRQLCCHPGMFIESYSGGSGKLDLLTELLDRLFEERHRVLIFSQFTSMLDIIRRQQAARGRAVFYIDGDVSPEDRLSQVNRFNRGEGKLFLISLRAGGSGLNLTGADAVIHFDPWWNPAVEDQATDRAHRIGQNRAVQIFKLVTRGTVEEKISRLKLEKQELIESIIRPSRNPLGHLSRAALLKLFE